MFTHHAYVSEKQVAFKAKFYGYDNAVEGWRALQNATPPADLGDYLTGSARSRVCFDGRRRDAFCCCRYIRGRRSSTYGPHSPTRVDGGGRNAGGRLGRRLP